MSGRVPTPMVAVSSGLLSGSSGWEQRQRTPMHRTNSSGAFPAHQRLGSALASAHGRSRLDIVGEGGSEQASPATTPPDMAVRQRHSFLQGESQHLPLWLRSEGDADGAQAASASQPKQTPLWLLDDSGGGDRSWGSASSNHSQAQAGATPEPSASGSHIRGSCTGQASSFLGNSAYQPSIASSYQAPQRLNSQSQGRRSGLVEARPPTGTIRARDELQC